MDTIFGIPANTLAAMLAVLLAMIGAVVLIIALRYPVPFKLGLRNLKRRRSQTALIIAGLALSTLIITSALGIGDTVAFSVTSSVYDDLGAIDEQIGYVQEDSGSTLGFGSSGPELAPSESIWFDEDIAAKLAANYNESLVDGIAPAVVENLPAFNDTEGLSESTIEVRGIGKTAGDGFDIPADLTLLEDGEAIINQSLAQSLNLQIGQMISIVNGQPINFRVASIVQDGGLSGTAPAMILPLAITQELFSKPDQITKIYISNAGDAFDGPNLTEEVIASISQDLGELQVQAVKSDRLEAAAQSAEFITTLFVTHRRWV
ncbi:MAG: ABC transporter permease, partial [Candidatus Promineifilaceae bacterium]